MARSGLKWKNLSENNCPQCGNKIERGSGDDYQCNKCGFFCRRSRAIEIIGDMTEQSGTDEDADAFFRSKGVDPMKI